MDKARVHRLNFFEPEAKAIHSLCYDKNCSRLAVSRYDASIEIWDLKFKPYLERVIHGTSSRSIEALAWCNGRLFSAGLQGKIIEYDLFNLTEKYGTSVAVGCSIWCMSLNKENTLLAAGTEDGHVSIYRISETGLDFEKILNKQEDRVLCLAWHESGEIIVTGSIDVIQIYNVHSGRATDRILVGRSEKHAETIIWCLAITKDMTIISGDSCGRTSFWDGRTATMISFSTTHKADVLALCLSEDENMVYTSGVDPIIIMHVRSENEVRKMWMKSVQRHIHTHDVRALQLAGNYLVSGGVDTNLVFSKFPPKTVIPFSPFSQASYCSIATKKSCVLLRYPKYVELWSLGETTAKPGLDGEHLSLTSSPVKLIQIKCESDGIITCCAVSKDAKWIAYSTLHWVSVYRIKWPKDLPSQRPVVQKVSNISCVMQESAKCLSFLSKQLLIATDCGTLRTLELVLHSPEFLSEFYNNDFKLSERFHLMTVSSDEKYVALGAHDGNVSIFSMKKGKVHCVLPSYKCQPTAMEFDLDCENLIIAYSDRKIVEYNISEKTYSQWCQRQRFRNFQDCSFYPIRGITFVPNNKNLLLVFDEDAVYVFDKSVEFEPNSKRKKEESMERNNLKVQSNISDGSYKVIRKYKHLLEFKCVKDDEIVAVEIPPTHILSSLPPPLLRKKYGT